MYIAAERVFIPYSKTTKALDRPNSKMLSSSVLPIFGSSVDV